jgi:hypothetical protein
MEELIAPCDKVGAIKEPLIHTGTWGYAVRKGFPAECFSSAHLSRHAAAWTSECDRSLERHVRYFEQSGDLVMTGFVDQRDYKMRTLRLVGGADGDYGGCRVTRKSSIAVTFILFGRNGTRITLEFFVRAQTGTFTSVGEVELVALFEAGKVALVLGALLEAMLGFPIELELYSDSATALAVSKAGFSKAMCSSTKTYGVKMAWLKEHLSKHCFKVDTRRNFTDIGTKPLPTAAFLKHRRFLGEMNMSEVSTHRCSCRCACLFGFAEIQCCNYVQESGLCQACAGDRCKCDCCYGDTEQVGRKERWRPEPPLP